jgi:Ni,Fe-hydrogenase III small subunit
MEITSPRYDVEVELIGRDGNAMVLLGAVTRELKRHLRNDLGKNPEETSTIVGEFMAEATSGDYDHLLLTCTRWVNVT